MGTIPSTTSALLAPSEFATPGDAKVNVAVFPAASLIVPLLSTSAVVLS